MTDQFTVELLRERKFRIFS